MAESYQWTPAEVDAMDPEFIDELMTFQTAQRDHELFSVEKPDPATVRQQAQRKAALLRWRERVKRGKSSGH